MLHKKEQQESVVTEEERHKCGPEPFLFHTLSDPSVADRAMCPTNAECPDCPEQAQTIQPESASAVSGNGGGGCGSGGEDSGDVKENMSSGVGSLTPVSSSASLDVSSRSSNSSVADLEVEEEDFFEGVEKLLEVWFTKGSKDGKSSVEEGDLRRIPRNELEHMLSNVRCAIVSSARNSLLDSYVLSESSMFISQRRIVLKTCGTTTPLECLHHLVQLVKKYAGFDTIEDIFYSRKNFERPDLQLKPYQHFDQEVELLDEIFADGAAYCMGPINRDCWYFYTLNPLDRLVIGRVDTEQDQTVEILMTELDQEVMKIFTKAVAKDGKEATKLSGIDTIIPGMQIDDFLFDPCGYSMNGILRNDSKDYGLGEYMTIHITPEPECSYVSFETNVPLPTYLGLIKRVLEIFLPGKFTLTVFANKTSMAAEYHRELQLCQQYNDWIRKDINYCSMQNYELTYAHFVKFPS